MTLIARLLINGFAVFVAGYFLKSGVKIDGFLSAIIVAFLLGLVNILIKPILNLIFFPLNLITFGLFSFFINGVLVLLISTFVKGFFVKDIWWAIGFSLVFSFVNWFFHLLTK